MFDTIEATDVLKNFHQAALDWLLAGRVKFSDELNGKPCKMQWQYRSRGCRKFQPICREDLEADAYIFLLDRWGDITPTEVKRLVATAKLNARSYDLAAIRKRIGRQVRQAV